MKTKKKLYVDSKLRVVHDVSKAKAIVNSLSGNSYQVLFLEPIAHDLSLFEAVEACRKWVRKNYPQFFNNGKIVLATPEICFLANKGEKEVKVHSCHTSRYIVGTQKQITYRVFINEKGLVDYGWGKQKNVYATLCIFKNKFEKINKNLNWDDYDLVVPKSNPNRSEQ